MPTKEICLPFCYIGKVCSWVSFYIRVFLLLPLKNKFIKISLSVAAPSTSDLKSTSVALNTEQKPTVASESQLTGKRHQLDVVSWMNCVQYSLDQAFPQGNH